MQWEPVTVTEFTYDSDGRLLRSVEQREPEFDEDDVNQLLALQAIRRDTGRYGESLSEAMSPQAHPNYTEPDAIRFIPHVRVNHAEEAIELYKEQHKEELPRGATFWVERKTFE